MKRVTAAVADDGFLRTYMQDFSWVAAGMGAAMLVDFAFYILAGRLMSPTEFGYFGVLTALYYIFLRSPFRAVEIAAKKLAAEGRDSVAEMGWSALAAGLAMFTLFLVLSGPIAAVLEVPRAAVMVFALVFPVGYVLAVLVGTVQGQRRYAVYGRYEFLSSLLAFAAILLVYQGFGAAGAVTVFVIEIMAGLAVLLRGVDVRVARQRFTEHRLLLDAFVLIAAVHATFSLDLLLVNHLFSAATTGLYNTVAVLGKGLFFGAVAVNRAVFPRFVTDHADRWRNLVVSQVLVVLGGLFAAGFFVVVGGPFIAATFGPGYTAAAGFAPHYMLMITGISAATLLANERLSVDSRDVRWIAVMPVLQAVLMAMFHGSVVEIMYATLAAAILTVLVLVIRRGRN